MTTTYTLRTFLDSGIDSLLRVIEQNITTLDIPFIVAGATAKNIVLHHIYERPRARKATDIKTIIMIANWDQFKQVKANLLQQDMRPTAYTHRIIDNNSGLPVDIIPFGNIDNDNKGISWPPAHIVDMSVLGFLEVHQNTLNIDIGRNCQIKVASIAVQALLNLVAWRDRRLFTVKDAADFLTVVEQYQFVQQHRLFDDYVPVEQLAFETQRIGAYLLGFDVCSLIIKPTWPCLEEIRCELNEQFIFALTKTNSTLTADEIEQLVADFWLGVGEDVVLVG